MAPRAYWKGYLKLSLVSASINLNLCWTVVKRDVLALGISSIFQTLTKCLEKIRGVGREQPDDRHRPLLRSRANGQAPAPPSVAMKSAVGFGWPCAPPVGVMPMQWRPTSRYVTLGAQSGSVGF